MTTIPGIDVSNYQGSDIGTLLQRYNPQHVVVRLSTESADKVQIARDQLRQGYVHCQSVSGYIWCDWTILPEQRVNTALKLVAEQTAAPLQMVWLDVEQQQGIPAEMLDDWLSRAVDTVERACYRCGIYTGKYFWEAYVADQAAFARLPLWLAHYDEDASLEDDLLPVGAWTKLAGKQWTDSPVDQDVFDSEVLHPETSDPCADLKGAIAMELSKPRLNRKRLQALIGEG